MDANPEALWAEANSLGRPRLNWLKGPAGVAASRKLIADWEQANPELAARYRALAEEASAAERAREARQLETRQRQWVRQRLLDTGVGQRNVDALEREVLETPAVLAVREQAATFLLLSGAPGAGKTLAAALALKLRLLGEDRGRPVYAKAAEFSGLSLFDAEHRRRLRDMRLASVLVVDDLGVESFHDTCRQLLEDVLDERYQARLPTVLTTNLDVRTFIARYGERIADRLRHDGQVVACGRVSLRAPEAHP